MNLIIKNNVFIFWSLIEKVKQNNKFYTTIKKLSQCAEKIISFAKNFSSMKIIKMFMFEVHEYLNLN